MRENLPAALKEIFGHEGGLSLDRGDRGNWTSGKIGVGRLEGTKYGVSAMAYPDLDIRRLTLAQAAAIYARDYWTPAGCDTLFPGVDLCVFDTAVNSGPSRAIKILRQVVGSNDHSVTVKKYCAQRLAFMRGIGTWSRYGKGWTRRVAKIEAVGVSWALKAMGLRAPEVVQKLDTSAAKAETKAKQQAGGAVATGTAGAGTGGTAATVDPSSFDWTAWVFVAVVVALLVGLAVFLWSRARVNKARGDAYRDVADRERDHEEVREEGQSIGAIANALAKRQAEERAAAEQAQKRPRVEVVRPGKFPRDEW